VTAGPPEGGRVRPCPRCGALNGPDFDRCVRCNAALSAVAVGAERVSGWLDGRRLLATKMLLAMTSVVFAGQLAAALSRGHMPQIGLVSSRDEAAVAAVIDAIRFGALFPVPSFEPWRVLSAVFVHFGVLHFAMNMLGLVNLARIAEPATGSARFVVAYVATGIIGFAVSAFWSLSTARPVSTAGASGAIFGVMGLILGWLIRRRDPRWKPFAMQAVFYSLLFGVMIRANNAAHLGGLVSGIAFGLVYAGGRRRRWTEPVFNVLAALGLLASTASILLSLRSPLWQRLDEEARASLDAEAAPDPGAGAPSVPQEASAPADGPAGDGPPPDGGAARGVGEADDSGVIATARPNV
jgi:membrane associated rhomboid family serine protease